MMRKLLVIITVLASMMVVGFPTSAQTEIRQWAARAEASSQYTTTDWSASRATGAPDAGTTCVDSVNAWASLEVTDDETLTLYYNTPVEPTQINIHQNYNPGAITSVELIPEEGDFTIPIANSADTRTACPGVFSLDVNLSLNVIGVIIRLDQTLIADWNEIDAVELVGLGNAGSSASSGPGSSSSSSNTSPTPEPSPTAPSPDSGSGEYVAPDGPMGVDVTCPNGREIKNGVKVTVVQMRTGFDYTATAVGINGFDPVLAVLDPRGRAALCNDDERSAAGYSADLPTTGLVPSSSTTAQVPFRNTGSGFSDVSLVVGGFNEGEEGEFILILEGMAYTSADNYGDPFAMEITPGMIASGVDPTVYMVSITNRLDPYISMVDGNGDYVVDEKGNQLWYCDDAGSASCFGESSIMTGSYVSRTANRYLGGFGLDAMLTIPLEAGYEFLVANFLMHSANFDSFGDYLVAFHMGIANASSRNDA